MNNDRLTCALFLLLCGVLLLWMSGHTYSPDEETMYAVTQGIALTGSVAVVVPDGAPVSALRPGLAGHVYSPYGLLPSLLALPLFWLGMLFGTDSPAAFAYATHFTVTMLNVPLTAATATVLFVWVRRLGVRSLYGALLALSYCFGTLAWPYARTFFSEPLAALLLLVAAERVDAAQRGVAGAACASGFAAGLLLTTRIASAVALPILVLALCLPLSKAGERRRHLRRLVLWGLGLVPGLLLLVLYNQLRFGTPLATGYGSEAGLFTTPMLTGLYGLLLSPGKGLIFYAPPVLLALPGAVRLWSRERGGVLLLLGLALSHSLLYATWGEWQGGGVWGPRFLLPIVAPLLVLAAGILPAPGQRIGRGAGLLLASTALLGMIGNLGGVVIHPATYLNTPGVVARIDRLADSALVAHWRILADRVQRYMASTPNCALADGLFPSEGSTGAPLPRRSGSRATITCSVNTPARLRFDLDDRRPPNAPSSNLTLTLGAQQLGQPPAHQLRHYEILLQQTATLIITTTPWNPQQVGFSPRNDALGPLISLLSLTAFNGERAPIVDRAIAPLPQLLRPRWAWYYDPANQHLADHWAWYLPQSELPLGTRWLLGGFVLVVGGGLLGQGFRSWRQSGKA